MSMHLHSYLCINSHGTGLDRLYLAGSFGKCFLAIRDKDGARIALKVFGSARIDTTKQQAQDEWLLLHNLHRNYSCPTIIRLSGIGSALTTGDKQLVITTYFVETTPFSLLITSLQPRQMLKFISALFGALKHLHAARIVHRDIKPSNFLANADCSDCKLADFGLSSADDGRLSRAGTSGYRSPEALLDGPTSAKSDVWSAGVMVAALVGRRESVFERRQTVEDELCDISRLVGSVSLLQLARQLDYQSTSCMLAATTWHSV